MPYQPRRYSNSLGIPQELQQPPQPAHAPIPLAENKASDEAPRPKRRLGLEKLSLRTYEPDMLKIAKTMIGKEVTIDDTTGQLVRHAQS
jgi:hypothetical protein